MRLVFVSCGLLLCVNFFPVSSHAFGKKRTPEPPADTQAYPTRLVSFGKFLDTPFMLPDGKTRVDMSVVLPELVLTQMAQTTRKIRSRGNTPDGSANDRFIFLGGVVAFEANNFSNSITIGYRPGVGDIGNGVLTGVEGTLKFTIGTLDMDFHVYDTVRKEVVAVGRGSALTGGGSLDVEIDFGAIKSAADFVYNSPMAPHFRTAVQRAIKQMADDPNTNFYMDWAAQVTNVNTDLKKIFFNSGQRDDIQPTNVFTIYDGSNMRLGEVKVDTTEFEQSSATYKDDSGDKLLHSTKNGDTVKIFFKTVP